MLQPIRLLHMWWRTGQEPHHTQRCCQRHRPPSGFLNRVGRADELLPLPTTTHPATICNASQGVGITFGCGGWLAATVELLC